MGQKSHFTRYCLLILCLCISNLIFVRITVRKLGDGFAEFQCTLTLSVELTLNKAVTYRYLVHSVRDGTPVDHSDGPFEFLTHDGVPACRCMMIEDIVSEGTCNVQYYIEYIF